MDKIFKQKLIKAGINLNRLTFQYILISYLILLLIREFNKNFLKQLNLNYLLIIVIVLGVITVLTYNPKKKKQEKPKKTDYYLIYLLGIAGTILIYFKIKSLGYLSYIISIIAGILIILLSKLVMEEDEENNAE